MALMPMRCASRAAALSVLALTLILVALPGAAWGGQEPRYVFLFIGDGMGIAQRAAAAACLGRPLAMDAFPAHGVTTTFASDSFVTDSAASATALATGVKTSLGRLGLGPDLAPLASVAELARDRGMRVGIVSSVSLDHATPAAFYAHVPSRGQYHEIAQALVASGFDYFGGGGLRDPGGSRARSPLGDALEQARAWGWQVAVGREAMAGLRPGQRAIAINARLHDGQSLPYSMDMTPEDVTLAEFTARGIELLDNPNGFFMMVEGGKIDWACHANDAAAALADTLAFDQAVAVAARFATSRPGQVLVVVTGDHECGGLTLSLSGTRPMAFPAVLRHQRMSLQRFADEVLPGFARGPGQGRFEALLPLLGELFGLGADGAAPLALDADELETLRAAFVRSRAGGGPEPAPGGYDPLAVALGSILGRKAGLGWTSQRHSGVPVSTSALGVGQERFSGAYDNAALGRTLLALMGLGPGPALPVYAASLRTVPSVLP